MGKCGLEISVNHGGGHFNIEAVKDEWNVCTTFGCSLNPAFFLLLIQKLLSKHQTLNKMLVNVESWMTMGISSSLNVKDIYD